jgi:hypothetical protein
MTYSSFAEVKITVQNVGAEFEALVGIAAENEYNILDARGASKYTIEKDGDTWVFSGRATGRESYYANLTGYFDGAHWFDEGQKYYYRDFREAFKKPGGRVHFEYTDFNEEEKWIRTGAATVWGTHFGVGLELDHETEVVATIVGYRDAFGLSLVEALEALLGDEVAQNFLEFWKPDHGDETPTFEQVEVWNELTMGVQGPSI